MIGNIIDGKPPAIPSPEPEDGHEVVLLNNAKFRYDRATSLFLEVREEKAMAQEVSALAIDNAIERYVWSETDPEIDDILMFALEDVETAAGCLHRLILAARKYAMMEAADNRIDDDEDDDESKVVHLYDVATENTNGFVDTEDGVDPIHFYGCG